MSFGITTATLDFEPLKEIGQQGRNSKVYLAHDKQLDAELVIKKIEKSKFANASEFYTEAKRLYDSEHQHVVQIKYACEDNDHIYLAMPFYKNGSLKSLIDNKFLTVREIIRYSTQFLSGLHNIHVKGLIHFDIKPDNILLSNVDEALVSDFGLSKAMNTLGLSSPDQVYPRHMPPETFTQSVHSMLYDIYNAGLTLYRLCNGNNHFYGQLNQYGNNQQAYIQAICNGTFPNRDLYLAHIPKSLRKVINKALSPNQADRHQTVLELINEISPIANLLDWKFVSNGSGNSWELEDVDKRIVVTLTSNGSIFDIETNKTIFLSGNTTKVSAGCKQGISAKNLDKEIQSILVALE